MSNAKLQALKGVLERQTKRYSEYLLLAAEQRRCLVNHQIEDLNAVNLEIDECTQDIHELENHRLMIFKQLEEIECRDFKKIKDVCDYYDNDDSIFLKEALEELKLVLGQVVKLNSINKKLIQSSREYIRSTMAIVTGFIPTHENQKFKTYGESGKFNGLRSQQFRLMNKEV